MAVAGATATASQGRSKLDRALERAVAEQPDAPQQVIMSGPPLCLAAVRAALVAHGDHVKGHVQPSGVLVATVHGVDVPIFGSDASCVQAISSDALVAAETKPTKNSGGETTSALRATLGLTPTSPQGTWLGVAVIDSGIAPLADFGARITAFYDFTAGDVPTTPHDDYGHGTHVAGLIAGDGSSSAAYQGVAPGARLIGLKVLDHTGTGRTSDVIRAIDFARLNKAALGIDVINLSLGHPILESAATDPLVQAVERAVRDGIVVVTSAGNVGRGAEGQVGYAGLTSPGNAPSAITVGAFKTEDTVGRGDDRVADYSSRGPTWYDAFAKPDLVAPGTRLGSLTKSTTALYQTYPELRIDASHMKLSGTSMAAAVTSGVAALVLEASKGGALGSCTGCLTRPALTPNALKAVLQYTALKLRDAQGVEYDALTQGAGGINAAGALALALGIDTSMTPGSAWLIYGVTPYTTIDGQSLEWAQNIVWGDNIVWGEGIIAVNQEAWASNIVWGDSADDNIVWGNEAGDNIVWGQNIVWGDNIVWGQNIVWADNIVWGDGLIGLMSDDDNIVWGNDDNIVWGQLTDDNIVWGNLFDDNIVWGNDVWTLVYNE